MKRIFRIGTRGSALALAQAETIRRTLKKKFPGNDFRLLVVQTRGDEFQSVEIFKEKQFGIFTKAIEKKLIKKEIDIAVHSLKDLPTELPAGLCLAAFPKRLNPQDVLISRKHFSLETLPKGVVVGTGSLRRKRQILLARPDLKLVDIRGNLDTRIRGVLKERKYDAVVVAYAGLKRLNKYLKFSKLISSKKILPAVGQGALGLEARTADTVILKILRSLNHVETEIKVLAEREFLRTLHGGCRVPVGIVTQIKNGRLCIQAAVFSVRNNHFITGTINGPKKNYNKMAKNLAVQLLKKGANRLLREARYD